MEANFSASSNTSAFSTAAATVGNLQSSIISGEERAYDFILTKLLLPLLICKEHIKFQYCDTREDIRAMTINFYEYGNELSDFEYTMHSDKETISTTQCQIDSLSDSSATAAQTTSKSRDIKV